MGALQGQHVLITGAASGLGRELARQLVAHGPRLLLLDRDGDGVARLAAELTDAEALTCDITDLDQVAATFADIEQRHGHLDVLVNNAGVWTDNVIDARDPQRRREVLLVNALGPMQVTDAALPLLRRSSEVAQVVNVVSASAATNTQSNDNRRWITYGASKSALAGFTTTLTAQLAPEGIKVCGIFPGGFESDMYEAADSSEEQHDAVWMMGTAAVAEIVVFALTRPPDVQVERLLVTKRFPPAV